MKDIKFPVFGNPNCKVCAGKGHIRRYASTDDEKGFMEGCSCLKSEAMKIMQALPDIQLDTTFIVKNNIKCTAIIEKVETTEVVSDETSTTVDAEIVK